MNQTDPHRAARAEPSGSSVGPPRRARNIAVVLCLVLACFANTGCLLADRSIVATVRDPAAVSLSIAAPGGHDSSASIAGDGEDRSVALAAGTFSTGRSASAAYELDADRLPDHSVRLRWAHPPIVGGELDTVVSTAGRITLTGTDDASLVHFEGSRLRLPLFASLSGATDGDGGFVGYSASTTPTPRLGASVTVPLSLDTPTGNVIEVRRKVNPHRGVAIAAILVSSAFFGAFGGAYLAAAPGFGRGTSGETAFRAVGWSSVGIGGALDLLALPTLLAPSTDEIRRAESVRATPRRSAAPSRSGFANATVRIGDDGGSPRA